MVNKKDKKMKKIFYILALIPVVVSCQKEPSVSETDGEYMVYTEYDTDFNFNEPKTFYIPDSILVIDGIRSERSKTSGTDEIRNAYVTALKERGYTEVDEKENADLGIQISYISNTYHSVSYETPYWWWNFPGYWSPFYWGNWGYWGYGYPVYYSYSTNSILTEMLDLRAAEGEENKLPIVWNNFIAGDRSSISRYDLNRFKRGIEQAFAQSEYVSAL